MRTPALERVFVTGSKGQLGKAFVDRLSPDASVTGADVDDVDIADAGAVRAVVRDLRPTAIINCAAFTDVDGAEHRPLEAYRTNAEAVWCLAGLANELDAVLLHFSTEFVYDGTLDRPYTEDDDPAPQSVYGMTKLVGERFAGTAARSYVLRLSSLYGGHTRRTSVDWILRQAQSGGRVTAFADRTVSPSYVPDVVRVALDVLSSGAPFGLYNCGSVDWCTWADLAAHVLAACGRPDLLQRVPFVPQTDRAVRPRNCAMSAAKLCGAAVQPSRRWSEALSDYLMREGVASGGELPRRSSARNDSTSLSNL
jgi:dTDP-4-dehydrorhamnose reductase